MSVLFSQFYDPPSPKRKKKKKKKRLVEMETVYVESHGIDT